MTSFETEMLQFAASLKMTVADLKSLVSSVTGTPEGAKLMAMLYTIANPVDHTFLPDPRAAAHSAGRREITAFLWRYGSSVNSILKLDTE
ncbi:MAG TPA: hypothetical protein VG796_19765 [Verrucomicrobiales bacterium]|nr:hypothetical protein [Verrucomicrobiales bacterium]